MITSLPGFKPDTKELSISIFANNPPNDISIELKRLKRDIFIPNFCL